MAIASSTSAGPSAVAKAPLHEVAHGQRAPAGGAENGELGLEQHERGDPIGGRVGVRQAAADGAAVADGAIGDGRGDWHMSRTVGEGSLRSSIIAWVTPAPMTSLVPLSSMRFKDAMRPTSTRRDGIARRMLSIGPSVWPPARTRASPSAAARAATASSRLAAAT